MVKTGVGALPTRFEDDDDDDVIAVIPDEDDNDDSVEAFSLWDAATEVRALDDDEVDVAEEEGVSLS